MRITTSEHSILPDRMMKTFRQNLEKKEISILGKKNTTNKNKIGKAKKASNESNRKAWNYNPDYYPSGDDEAYISKKKCTTDTDCSSDMTCHTLSEKEKYCVPKKCLCPYVGTLDSGVLTGKADEEGLCKYETSTLIAQQKKKINEQCTSYGKLHIVLILQ